MRFSAVQEDGYGVGLGNDKLPENNNVDYSMMAATGEVEPVGENVVDESSMIYNLPLLFANGYPTSLDNISLVNTSINLKLSITKETNKRTEVIKILIVCSQPQLERFITFMVQCSLGHDTAQVVSKPPWWPKEVQFSAPFVRPANVDSVSLFILF